jgi:hypothetical protein
METTLGLPARVGRPTGDDYYQVIKHTCTRILALPCPIFFCLYYDFVWVCGCVGVFVCVCMCVCVDGRMRANPQEMVTTRCVYKSTRVIFALPNISLPCLALHCLLLILLCVCMCVCVYVDG